MELEFIKNFGPIIGIWLIFAIGIFRAIPVLYANRSPRAFWRLADTALDDYAARVDRYKVENERRRAETALDLAEVSLNHAVLERLPPPPPPLQKPCNCTPINAPVRRRTHRRGPYEDESEQPETED